MLPEGNWKVSDSDAIATRLVTALPKPGDPVPAAARASRLPIGLPSGLPPIVFRWLLWGALAGVGILLGLQF
jgi:hypothetical protein